MNTAQKTATIGNKNAAQKTKVSVSVDNGIMPLLELMLKKAHLNINDLTDTFISVWINENQDLLSKTEREKFKHLFLNQ